MAYLSRQSFLNVYKLDWYGLLAYYSIRFDNAFFVYFYETILFLTVLGIKSFEICVAYWYTWYDTHNCVNNKLTAHINLTYTHLRKLV